MVFQNGTLRELLLVAGLWLTASASVAAPQSDQVMALGSDALPPAPYVAFCERQPLDCGADAVQVLADARQADADRAALLAMLSPAAATGSVKAPNSLTASAPASPAQPDAHAAIELQPAPEPLEATVRPVALQVRFDFVAPEDRGRADAAAGVPAMTPELWALLNRVNDKINHAIIEQTDLRTYGVNDYWSTPLENGVRYGDCEDYVLEKERALLAAGLPRRALNIAVVTTPWGENHAVLLVATAAGEFVLDNISPWVKPWRETDYVWRQRQVNGEPFHWTMVRDPQLERALKAMIAQASASGSAPALEVASSR